MNENRDGEGARFGNSKRAVGDGETSSSTRQDLEVAWAWFPLEEHAQPLREPLRAAVAEALGEPQTTTALEALKARLQRTWRGRLPVEIGLLLGRIEAASTYSEGEASKKADHTA